MRYHGTSLSCEEYCVIRDVTISKSSISIDYVENGAVCLVKAESKDGVRFKGTYGCPSIPASKVMGKILLELFRGQGGKVVLLAEWSDHSTGNEGTWIFVLEKGPK